MMYFVFFSPEEVVLHHAVPPHTSVTDTYCAVVLHDGVWPVLHSKQSHLLQNGVILFLHII